MIGLSEPEKSTRWWSKIKQMFQLVVGAGSHGSGRSACLSCGGSRNGQENSLALCRGCFDRIPWITEICCLICGRPEDCPDCRRRPDTYYCYSRSAVKYDALMKEWLAAYKYRGNERMVSVLTGMLVHAYHQLHKEILAQGGSFDCVSYVPMNPSRLEERGFNQAEAMASDLGVLLRLPVVPLLERTRHTAKQSFKSRSDRLRDLEGAFQVRREGREWLRGYSQTFGRTTLRVLILDDVYTTGSTLNQCAKTLTREFPLEVYGLMWAR